MLEIDTRRNELTGGCSPQTLSGRLNPGLGRLEDLDKPGLLERLAFAVPDRQHLDVLLCGRAHLVTAAVLVAWAF